MSLQTTYRSDSVHSAQLYSNKGFFQRPFFFHTTPFLPTVFLADLRKQISSNTPNFTSTSTMPASENSLRRHSDLQFYGGNFFV